MRYGCLHFVLLLFSVNLICCNSISSTMFVACSRGMRHYVQPMCLQSRNSTQWARRGAGRDAQRLAHGACLSTSGGGRGGHRSSRYHCAPAGGVLGQAASGQLRPHAEGRGGKVCNPRYSHFKYNHYNSWFVNCESLVLFTGYC
jgi:hypothetical protein